MNPILFFGEYKTPLEHYIPYFPTLNLKTPLFHDHNIQSNVSILTHSNGIVNALVFCELRKIKPKIICIDPPDIFKDHIEAKIGKGLNQDLEEVYRTFLDFDIKVKKYKIIVFRNSQLKFSDTDLFSKIVFYNEPTHYPYEIPKLRNKILQLLEN